METVKTNTPRSSVTPLLACILLIGAIVLLATCHANAEPLAKHKVDPAAPTPAPQLVLTMDDVRATIQHDQQLARDMQAHATALQGTITAQEKTITDQASTIRTQALDLSNAKAATVKIEATIPDLQKQITAQDQAYRAEREGKWRAMLFGFPITAIIFTVVGMCILPILKLGFKGAFTAATVGLKATTGI